jgi:alpha-beta hydrolase superfamily lysophospholipase
MVQDNTWFESSDGTKLYLRRWSSQPRPAMQPGSASQPLAIVHIVHGMAEHSQRYGRLAEKLCEAGIEVWAADQRGHGKTADIGINNPGKGGILGHCADSDTFGRITADIHGINEAIQKLYPGIPLFLLGHSWGSFIIQNYIEGKNGGLTINGCVLSGTRGPDGFKIKSGIPFMTVLAALRGQRKGSKIARAMADGPYNQPFRPNRTDFDWISRDEAEVDAYVNDPHCGYLCSTGFYRDLARGLYRIHQPEQMACIDRDLPVYILSGSADPVGDMGVSPTKLVNAYCLLGIKDLEFVLYPGARHETLNETNREEVMGNLLSWICRHTGKAEATQPSIKIEK